jgi:hypothetical protein
MEPTGAVQRVSIVSRSSTTNVLNVVLHVSFTSRTTVEPLVTIGEACCLDDALCTTAPLAGSRYAAVAQIGEAPPLS